jgi:hypothetical protein
MEIAMEIAIEKGRIRLGIIELLSLFSLSLIAILQANSSESEESGKEESSN